MGLGLPAAGQTAEIPPELEAKLDADQRRLVRRCLVVLATLSAGSIAGAASVLYLANHYPLLLIALSPIGRHLILIAPTVAPAPFVAVATLRSLAFYVPCYLLGRALGAKGLEWLETRNPKVARWVHWLNRLFQRARYPAVFLFPGPIMSAIAGNARMPGATWIAWIVSGLVVRMIVIVWFGEWLREPIEELLALFDEYWIPGTIVLVGGTLLYQWRKRLLVR